MFRRETPIAPDVRASKAEMLDLWRPHGWRFVDWRSKYPYAKGSNAAFHLRHRGGIPEICCPGLYERLAMVVVFSVIMETFCSL
jgi:hypothetical protein